MRSISLVQKREFEFKGTVFQNAVTLVDLDNDGHNEFCVCNTNGDLQVFKGKFVRVPTWYVTPAVHMINTDPLGQLHCLYIVVNDVMSRKYNS